MFASFVNRAEFRDFLNDRRSALDRPGGGQSRAVFGFRGEVVPTNQSCLTLQYAPTPSTYPSSLVPIREFKNPNPDAPLNVLHSTQISLYQSTVQTSLGFTILCPPVPRETSINGTSRHK